MACDALPALTHQIWALKDQGGWRTMDADEIVAYGLPAHDDPVWTAAVSLFGRDWFQRLWIVQEIVLAPSAVVLCGDKTLEWLVMVHFVVAVMDSRVVPAIAAMHSPVMGQALADLSMRGIWLVRLAWQLQQGLRDPGTGRKAMALALGLMQTQRATVKVDHVYAVLGLLPEELGIKVVVDYSEETKQNYGLVHAAFFRQCLERLEDWPSIQFQPQAAPAGNAPSWCPRWEGDWNSAVMLSAGCQAGRPTQTSCLRSFNNPSPAAAKEDGILCIAGISVDTVQDIISLDRTADTNLAAILQVFIDCAPHTPDGADGPARLLGALIGDCGWLNRPNFSKAPDGHLLRGLLGFLRPLVAHHSGHKDEAGYVPLNINTADYFLGEHQFWREYLNFVSLRWKNRNIAVTGYGRLGLVSRATKLGDTVCVFLGATLPQVISRHEDGVHWTYLGPTAVDGLLDGEVFAADDWQDKKEIFYLK